MVHWDKVPDSGIVYCLCADHSLRGICWHVMLWLVSNNVVSLPPKWSAATIAGPSVRGRDRHYVDGSALLRYISVALCCYEVEMFLSPIH